MCFEYRILLIDEPEVFLHPPLAKKLGYTLATISARRKGTVFASTHSADFLMGCIESGQPINVIRLTYSAEAPTARALPSNKLQEMMRDPLLRSTNVLSALFHNGAVVCEADADRALYEEINFRLSTFGDEAARDCVFLNAQNKQTVVRISSALRQMGIPAAAVVDLDIVKGSDDFKKLLHGCSVPQPLINSWGALRGEIYERMKNEAIDPKYDGFSKLRPDTQASLSSLLRNLMSYGIFVVPEGSMESWLRDLGATRYSAVVVGNVLEKLGNNPVENNYIKPTKGDVWDFLRKIGIWLSDPSRYVIP